MSSQQPKKKVVVTTKKQEEIKKPTPTAQVKSKRTVALQANRPLTYTRINYIWMGAGVVLIALGLMLMAGGSMPNPDVWDENIIYSFRRITLAPILIVAGLVVEIVGIFKSDNSVV